MGAGEHGRRGPRPGRRGTQRPCPQPVDPAQLSDADPADPFVLDECLWVADGDWPGTPAAWSLRYLPADSIGVRVETVLHGEYLDIDPDDEPALLALAAEQQWSMRRDDDLVNRLGRNVS